MFSKEAQDHIPHIVQEQILSLSKNDSLNS